MRFSFLFWQLISDLAQHDISFKIER